MALSPLFRTPEDALSLVQSGHRLFVQGSACTPSFLLRHLAARRHELEHVELVGISWYGDVAVTAPECAQAFRVNSLFVSEPTRQAVQEGRADFVPVFLSEIPLLFKRKILPLDGALVQVSPPDRHGYCSLGVSVDIARAAVDAARYTIAQVNPNMPRTHGNSLVHYRDFDALVWGDTPLHEVRFGDHCGEAEAKVGEHVASLIRDGDTLQMGIGAIPDAVLRCLHDRRELGVHTEMFSDGLLELFEKGVVTNRRKVVFPERTLVGFAVGTRKLYDYVDDNPAFAFQEIDLVNNPSIIAQNPNMVAINSAIEIDLTGQVCADSIGTYQYSGIGGQMDFMRGAALSEGGRPIIALTSRTKKGQPRIVPQLRAGAGVVTTRGHVHYVVTEYGVAYLFGRNLRQRAEALINIAHPDDREMLESAFSQRYP
jgi:acyl-CoA hydrolase